MPSIDAAALDLVFDKLLAVYGPQHWWPARSRFEVLVGAVLVQNTAWKNAEQAIAQLRANRLLAAQRLLDTSADRLAPLLRPAGCYNLKTRRLQNLCRWFVGRGGFARLDKLSTSDLRVGLLNVNGVGPETADAILLYAFERPVFVADAYALRILMRVGLTAEKSSYAWLQTAVTRAAPGRAAWLNELHALLVAHGKQHCRPRPRCSACPLGPHCRYALTKISTV